MKKYLLLLAAGAIALPGLAIADAHGYSSSISGNVRINHLQTTDGDISTASTLTGGGDSYLQWNHNYDPSETKSVTGFIRFKSGGDQRINVTGSATEGDWTANAVAEWEVSDAVSSETVTLVGVDTNGSGNDNNASVVESVSGGTTAAQRDQYVQLTNVNGASVFFGRKAPFDSLKGSVLDYSGSMYSGDDGESTNDIGYHAASVDDLTDSRFNYIQLGYDMGNGAALNLKLQMDNTGNTPAMLGYDLDTDISGTDMVYDISANAISVDYAMGPIDAAVSIGSGTAETSTDRGDAAASFDVSLTKLGLNYDIGVAQVHLNYTALSEEGEYIDSDDSATVKTEVDYTGTNIGVSAAAGGGTVIFDMTTTDVSGAADTSGSATEVGYLTSIGGASFKAIYGTGSYDDKDASTNDDDSYLHLRLEYGF